MPAVVERDETKGNDDQQDGFLMDVPAEEEGGVGTEGSGCHEVGPRGL